ncbi:hypothetical protein E2C01_094800 [Portunus trituberculatus]|uniref:Uncharacterized protein n=1 Tax=Portunus trituberculatus TaxID=210409 RepID=A0A5B7JX41_PORTR|nr:hypothetical protein [Portunus trituberculatus]
MNDTQCSPPLLAHGCLANSVPRTLLRHGQEVYKAAFHLISPRLQLLRQDPIDWDSPAQLSDFVRNF